MKLADLNEWLTVLTNIGVLAGIIFLAIELNQNNTLMELQARESYSDKFSESNRTIVENPYLAEILIKEPSERTRVENVQLNAYRTSQIRNMEYVYFALPESELPIAVWQSMLRGESMRSFWDRNKAGYNSEFVAFLEYLNED